MKKSAKIFGLMIAFSILISSAAFASWAGVSSATADCAQLIVVGVSLISAGSFLRERKESLASPE